MMQKVQSIFQHEFQGRTTNVKLEFAQYKNNGTLAVVLVRADKTENIERSEEKNHVCIPYATVTVNLPDSASLPANAQFVDSAGLPNIGHWLEENGIATPTEIVRVSNYCIYHAYAFNIPESIENKVREGREDSISSDIIDLIEHSGLKPDEKNDRGELYHLRSTGDFPNPTIIIYKGTDPDHLGEKNDVFLLATHREKGEQMWRFRNLPEKVRIQVSDSIKNAALKAKKRQ